MALIAAVSASTSPLELNIGQMPAQLARVVQIRHHGRHIFFSRDPVETGLRVARLGSRAFGRDDQVYRAAGSTQGRG